MSGPRKLLLATSIIVGTLLSSCATDPYEAEKEQVTKVINTLGDTELLRDIKFEKFEPSGAVLVSEVQLKLDSLSQKHKDYLTNELIPKRLERAKEILDFNREMYNISKSSIYADAIKFDKERVERNQNKLDSAKQGLFDNSLLDYYTQVQEEIATLVVSGDSLSYSFDVIYLIEQAKTTKTFTFAKTGVSSGKLTANDIVEVFQKTRSDAN